MAKQTFTTGQVLTAAQMTSLQQTAMGGGSATAKTASYTLVAADAGTTIIMNSASATTITVNTSLFAAGDTVLVINQGAGVCTITAGTATVNTAGSLALTQYETGQLYFLSTSAAIFTEYIQTAAVSGKVLQVVQGTYGTAASSTSSTFADTGLTASITPSSATSKVLVMQFTANCYKTGADTYLTLRLMRDSTAVHVISGLATGTGNTGAGITSLASNYLDSPATTSAVTYKTQFGNRVGGASGTVTVNYTAEGGSVVSTIILMEIGA